MPMKVSVFILHRTWTVLCAALVLACGASGRADAASGGAQQDGYFHFMQLTDTTTGEAYWVAGVNGHTWQVHQRGIVMRLQSERRSGLYAIARRDFIVHGSVNIRPVGPVSFPVRRYDIDNVNDDVVPCYTGLIIDGVLSGGRELHLRLTLDGLQYHAAGTADASDGFSDHGGAILDRAGIPRAFAFPAVTADIPIPFTKSGSWLSVDHVAEELRKPVMVSDPRVLLARYTENYPQISIDREDNVLLSGVAPLLESLPITPELIDDSISVRSVRTTKIRTDRSIAWSVYSGPVGFATITVLDRANNAIAVGVGSGRAPRGTGSYGPESHGSNDVMIRKWGPDGRLQWSTFVGGDSAEVAQCATVDSVGNIYVGCQTKSTNFPTTPGAFIEGKPNYRTRFDAAVFSLTGDGRQLRWSTFLSSQDTHSEDAIDQEVGGLGASLGGIAYDGVGGLIVGMHQYAPRALPTTPGAWQTVHRGASEGMISRFHLDGSVHWSTLISTRAYDIVYCVQNTQPNRTMIMADQRIGKDVFSLETLPSIGVPGRTMTEDGMYGFVYEFDSTGTPVLLWAPFASTELSSISQTHDSPFLSARTLHWNALGDITSDAIRVAPNCRSSYPDPSASLIDLSVADRPRAVFTSSYLGVANGPYVRFKTSPRLIVLRHERFPSRGACLTDTVWGSGFGDNSGERGYLVIVRRPQASSTPHDTVSTSSTITAFPNPTADMLTITSPDPITGVEVFTIDGRRVSAPVTQQMSDRCVVDLRDLTRAGYMLRIETSHTTEHHFVIKD